MKVSNSKRFEAIKNRVRDMRESHNMAIESGKFLHISADLVKETEWLIKELQRFTKDEPAADAVEEVAEEVEIVT